MKILQTFSYFKILQTLFWYFIPLVGAISVRTGACKCILGDECWPNKDEWLSLNRTVNGRLVATTFLADVCHDPTYNASACASAQAEWDFPPIHFSSSSSFMAPYFQNQTCDPYTSRDKPCNTLGNYVDYAINVTSPEDVVKGLKFARDKNVRVVIKNTGHDYLGKSTGKGALGIWTHNLKSITFSNYTSTAYTGPAIKMGAGVQAFEAYASAHAHGLRVVGGECPTVGLAGGYSQGGGHSALSSNYGLGADQTLEWEVVTADGELVTASPKENSDLYWALSGGGGGTYGVVISLTSKAHADGAVGGAFVEFLNTDPSSNVFWTAIEAWHSGLTALVDSGIMVLYTLSDVYFIILAVTAPGRSVSEVNNLLEPFRTTLAGLNITYSLNVTSFPSYYDHFNNYFGPLPYGIWPATNLQGGRLIPRSVVENNNTGLTSVVRSIATTPGFTFSGIALSVNHSVVGNSPSSNAVLPAWREALIFTSINGVWNFSLPLSQNHAQLGIMTDFIDPLLRDLTPGSGTYLNEANFADPYWKEEFYGENYPALRAVKRKWDKEDLFYARTAVGSDAWFEDGEGRLCRAKEGK